MAQTKFSYKIEICVQNRNFCTTYKFSYKSEIFVQHLNFCTKLTFLVKNRNFCTKSNVSYKIEIFVQNRNFRTKSKFSYKIEIFVQNFGLHTNFSSKKQIFLGLNIETLFKALIFGSKITVLSNYPNLGRKSIFEVENRTHKSKLEVPTQKLGTRSQKSNPTSKQET